MIDLPRGNELHPDGVASRSFPVVRRGFDQEGVRRFLEEIANQLRQLLANEAELRRKLVEAEQRAAHPDLDEATLSAAVGSETARVLQVAHEAAHEVLSRAEIRASELRGDAERILGERTASAEARAEEILAAGHQAAESAVAATREECRAMIEEAREARRRILEDLNDRRRALHVQLEQLRAGKDALARVVDGVAESIAEVRSRIFGVEEAAEVAAGGAASDESGVFDFDEDVEVELDEVVIAILDPNEVPPTPDDVEHLEETEDELGDPSDPATSEGAVVDALFARLRAEEDESADAAADPPTEVLEAVVDLQPGIASDATAPSAEAPRTEAAVEPESDRNGAIPEDVDSEPTGDERLLVQRNELIATPVSSLVRTMKRVLASEQNELLDALRNLAPRDDPLSLLTSGDGRGRIAAAAKPHLAEAFEAGATFAVRELGPAGSLAPKRSRADGERATASADRVAGELAGTIADALHRRVSEGMTEEDNGEAGIAPLVGVAYREWKGSRIEATAGDSVAHAFSLGVAEIARTRKVPVRWVVDDGSTPCPDCDDNGLTAPQATDEAFPTGQHEPPVHPGCRCVLVPVPA